MERMERVPRTASGQMSGLASGQAGYAGGAATARRPDWPVQGGSAEWDTIDVPASAVEALRGEVILLRERLAKAAPRRAVEEMDRAVSLLHRQMQSLAGARNDSAAEVAQQVAAEINALKSDISAVRASERFAALDAAVAGLGRRIEAIAARAADPVELAQLEAQGAELKALLEQALAGDALKPLADRIAACAEAVARAGEETSRRLAGVAGSVERNARMLLERTQQLEARVAESGRAVSAGLREDMRAVHDRLDAVSAQIAAHGAAGEDGEAATETARLADLVERHLLALTARFREAHDQLGRLDGIESRLGRLDRIEAALARLGEDMHRTREAGAAATEEALAALTLKLSAEAGTPTVVALKRGLAALEARQDEVERRAEAAYADQLEMELDEIAAALRRTEASVWAAEDVAEAEVPPAHETHAAPEVSPEPRAAAAEAPNTVRRRAERSARPEDQEAAPAAAGAHGRRVDWTAGRDGRPRLDRRKPGAGESLRRRAGLFALLAGAAAIFTTTAAGLAFSSGSGFVSGVTARLAGKVTPAPSDLPLPVGTAALQAAARSGDLAAAYEVGMRYADGRGVATDTGAAVKWLGFAVSQGYVPAAFRLGGLYETTAGDPAEARRFYEWAAENGNIRAMHNLAVLYSKGHFAAADGKPDWGQATGWFRKAAELGHRDSQYNLGVIEARGLAGAADPAAAYTWFAIAARQGDDESGRKRDAVAERLDPAALARARQAADGFSPKAADPRANIVIARPEWDAAVPTDQMAARAVSLAGKVAASRLASSGQ